MIMKARILGIVQAVGLLAVAICSQVCLAARQEPPAVVDMTKDGVAAKMAVDQNVVKRTYNLGPTGMRGFLYTTGEITAKARQILVTQVEIGSPADGVMKVGDVIVGIDGKPFNDDARRTFGHAIDGAEAKGLMNLVVSRDGKDQNVVLKLQVMGSYSATAPYDCPKSAKILEQGCQYIASKKDYGRFNFGVLALLASGRDEYKATVQDFVRGLVTDKEAMAFVQKVEKGEVSGRAWESGYGKFLVNEYYLATGDKTVLPYLRACAINTARGQGMYGTYGHGFSERQSNGELHGFIAPYGALNQAGLSCFIAMALAKKAGVEDPELTAALKRSEKFFGYYVGKGGIPYGEHPPNHWYHDDNGKSGSTALALLLDGNREGAQFFAKMDLAGFVGREFGHCGPFFGYMWGAPGANIGGPKAAATYFRQVRWHYDLERKWDCSFSYDETTGNAPGLTNRGILPTPIYMLTFALPLRKIYLTGKMQDKEMWLSDKDVTEAIEAGNFEGGGKTAAELVTALGNWSPTVRRKAAEALAKKPEADVQLLMKMAEGSNANARIGATLTLGYLKEKAVPALPVLSRLLVHEDRWLRVQAADALKAMGAAARPVAPDMLKAVALNDEKDPLLFAQNSLAHALFYGGGAVSGSPGVLAKSIDGIDKKTLLYPAVKAVAKNPDGHARGCLSTTYKQLTLEDVQALAPEIIDAMNELAPCNTMFSKGVIVGGIEMLARLKVKEGLPLAIKMLKWNMHGGGYVHSVAMGALKKYGGSAVEVLPELKKMQSEMLKQKKVPEESKELAKVIDAIEKDKNPRALVSIKSYLSEVQINRMSVPYGELKEVTSASMEKAEAK